MEIDLESVVSFFAETLVNSAFTAIFFTFLVGLFRNSLRSYVSMKAENLATKQDIAEITHAQKTVEHKFNLLLEMKRSEEQMRLAVAETRFHKHQEAYTLWLNLLRNVHEDSNVENSKKCSDWWDCNNLYLDKDPRKAFKSACIAAFHHHEFLKGPRDEASTKLIRENWEVIAGVGSLIEEAVALPSLGKAGFEGVDAVYTAERNVPHGGA